MSGDTGPGRAAQRRRTRKAIVDATSDLLSAGHDPSITDIARAADVSRRTIYTYFPTLDQLLLDATLGALSAGIDAEITASDSDPLVRVERTVDAICRSMAATLPLGRKLIKLTIDTPAGDGTPKRGYRRVQWIETAIEPLRSQLRPDRFETLVSSLTLVIGWEAFIVLSDVRGLTPEQAREVSLDAALALIRAATADASGQASILSEPSPRS